MSQIHFEDLGQDSPTSTIAEFFIGKMQVKDQVVSTIKSGVLFARFSIVEFIPTIYSFLVTSLTVEARNERES